MTTKEKLEEILDKINALPSHVFEGVHEFEIKAARDNILEILDHGQYQ